NYDSVWWDVDPVLQQTSQVGPYQDGNFFRRLRLQLDGTFWQIGEFNMEFQFEQLSNNNTGALQAPPATVALAGGAIAANSITSTNANPNGNGLVNLDEFWVGVRDVPILGTIRAGHVKAQQGLESLSSSKVIEFLERSSL